MAFRSGASLLFGWSPWPPKGAPAVLSGHALPSSSRNQFQHILTPLGTDRSPLQNSSSPSPPTSPGNSRPCLQTQSGQAFWQASCHGRWPVAVFVMTSTKGSESLTSGTQDPLLVFVMTSTKRSESLTSGTRDPLLVPLLSTLSQPRGNSCSSVSASSGHLLSSFTSLSDHLLLFWLTTPYIFPVQVTGVASVSGLYSEYLLIFSIVCFLIC